MAIFTKTAEKKVGSQNVYLHTIIRGSKIEEQLRYGLPQSQLMRS